MTAPCALWIAGAGHIAQAVAPLAEDASIGMGTLARPMGVDEAADPSKVKVVLDRQGFALYFSRAPIPYTHSAKGGLDTNRAFKHIGLYVYQRPFLLRFAALEPTPLEQNQARARAIRHASLRRRVRRDKPELFEEWTRRDKEREEETEALIAAADAEGPPEVRSQRRLVEALSSPWPGDSAPAERVKPSSSRSPSVYPQTFITQTDQGWVVPKAQGLNTTIK